MIQTIEFDRRELLKKIGLGLAGGVVTSVIADEIVQHLPDIGRAIGSIQLPEIPTPGPGSTEGSSQITPEPWMEQPVLSTQLHEDVNGYTVNGEYPYEVGPNLISWAEVDQHSERFSILVDMFINITNEGKDLSISVIDKNHVNSVNLEIFNPGDNPLEAWHKLLLYKRSKLAQKYGANSTISLTVLSSNSLSALDTISGTINDIK